MEGNPTCWRTGWRERKRLTAEAWRLLEIVIDVVVKGNPHLQPCREDVRYQIIKVGESLHLQSYIGCITNIGRDSSCYFLCCKK